MKFSSSKKLKPQNQAIVFDFGALWFKALHVSFKDGRPVLMNYFLERQEGEYFKSPDNLSKCIESVVKNLGVPTKKAVVSLNASNSVMKQTMMPVVPLPDMRKMLRVGAQNYLGQQLDNHTFDCEVISLDEKEPETLSTDENRSRVLVGGTKQNTMSDLKQAFNKSKYSLEHVVPCQVGIINSFEFCFPEKFKSSTIGLIDIGHSHSSICIIDCGDVGLTRNIQFGGDNLSVKEPVEQLAMGFDESTAFSLQEELEARSEDFIEDRLSSFMSEVSASLDFYAYTQEKEIDEIYVSGAGALNSDAIFRGIASKMPLKCNAWDPLDKIQRRLPIDKDKQLMEYKNQFGASIGAGLAFLN